MDIFSGIRNIQQTTYDKNISQSEVSKDITHKKVEEIQKDTLEKTSKEEIKKKLEEIVAELNKAMDPLNTDLEFKYNSKVDELMVLVVDKKSDKVIREFPPKEALKLMEKMRELVGMLFDKKG